MGQQPVCGEDNEASRPACVFAPTQMPVGEPVVIGSSSHNISRPLGDIGQPPPVHSPFASAMPLQVQLTLKSTHQCSPVKLDTLHAPVGPQSASVSHGSQLLPVPTHLPKRCAHVAMPRAGSHMPQVAALPHGQEGFTGSQASVQIFAPL